MTVREVVAARTERNPPTVRRPRGPQVQAAAAGEPGTVTAVHADEVHVGVAVVADAVDEREPASVRRPRRGGPAGKLVRVRPVSLGDPDPASAREREPPAVGRPRRLECAVFEPAPAASVEADE